MLASGQVARTPRPTLLVSGEVVRGARVEAQRRLKDLARSDKAGPLAGNRRSEVAVGRPVVLPC